MNSLENVLKFIKNEADLAPTSATPLYRRVKRALERSIENKIIGNEEALPSERDLAKALGVSRVTVRNAVALLVEEGLLVQRRGVPDRPDRRGPVACQGSDHCRNVKAAMG